MGSIQILPVFYVLGQWQPNISRNCRYRHSNIAIWDICTKRTTRSSWVLLWRQYERIFNFSSQVVSSVLTLIFHTKMGYHISLILIFFYFSLDYLVQNYLEDPSHNDFTEIEGDTDSLIQLRKELIDLVSMCVLVHPRLLRLTYFIQCYWY